MNEQLLIEYEMTMHNNVILSRSEGSHNNQILRSLHSLRMTKGKGVNVFSLSKGEGNKKRKELINLSTYPPINFKKVAFTLAEVLITLGIIGVVAALTIPELMTAYKAHQLRSQFLKSYSTIQQAFRQMEADDLSLDPTSYDTNNKFYKTFANYVNVAVDCGTYNTINIKLPSICFDYKRIDGVITYGGAYKTFNGSGFREDILDDGQLVLMDGTNIMFENWDRRFVSVDLNGFKNLPNQAGYDLFTFQFLDGDLRTMGSKGTDYSDLNKFCNIKSNDRYNGIACAHRAKTESDYFKWVVKNLK